jgi:putative acetyltransferase
MPPISRSAEGGAPPPAGEATNEILIRPVQADEAQAVSTLIEAAFAASDHGHNGEAALVRMLEADGDGLVSLGAWQGDRLVGHIFFSRMRVIADGKNLAAAALAPLAVAPDMRRRGIGARLVAAGHDRLQELGIGMAFLLGDAAYYGPLGYDVSRAAPFASPYAGPHFMAWALDSAQPRPQRGEAFYAEAFARLA